MHSGPLVAASRCAGEGTPQPSARAILATILLADSRERLDATLALRLQHGLMFSLKTVNILEKKMVQLPLLRIAMYS